MIDLFQKWLWYGKSHLAFSLFSLFLIVLNLIFRLPVQIINAVSFEPEPSFSVHISWLRILLEPFAGLPLFFIRGNETLEEYIALWGWLFALFILFLIMKEGKRFIRHLLFSLPAIIGVIYFILIWMIFWPLPSNTIINNSPNTILFNTHAHSHFSHDGLISPEEQMSWHERNGFHAFFLTEHNHNPNTLDLVQRQKEGTIATTPHVMAGIEFSGSNHMVLLGLTDSLITFGKQDSLVIAESHRQGALVGVAHWFDGRKNSVDYYIKSGADGFEIANKNQIAFPMTTHKDIADKCAENKLFLLGGADYHGYGPTCNTWNALEIPDWETLNHTEKTVAILSGLKKGNNRVLFYSDRRKMPHNNYWLSPPANVINYFRGLNGFQIMSWLGWCLLVVSLKVKWDWVCFIRWFPIVSGLAIFIQGRILISKSIPVIQHNDILLEYGNLFSVLGLLLFLLGGVVYYFGSRIK